ncbi:uncharacterized protein LOC131300374 [Rhododendron vialii]|uniref:uncharacterized protein LOC131300374 n=1 Tax=Rhododendron vialii TaxID=182163 RepID=UPI00265FCDB3|nr:uncharacterized protein LOC131300374 [Rhododendron vialii]
MDSTSLSFIVKKLIMLIVVVTFLASIVFVVDGEAKTICQAKCEDVADCDGFCKRIGFDSGKCFPPLYQYCCCQGCVIWAFIDS